IHLCVFAEDGEPNGPTPRRRSRFWTHRTDSRWM
ncbi:uncharacterized protein METZ01_LOCUS417334, partial [marine metagenome]